ncbi:MAG: O-antigen ligase family protein [Firmicutes bacterium]|nr:O-antigen ligase family protein [Bacillota bacterium]
MILKGKYAFIIVFIGIITGFLAGMWGPVALLGVAAFLTALALVLTKPETAVCFLVSYAVLDWGLRLVVPAMASLWDEAYLLALVLLWIFKWIVNRKEEGFQTAPLDLPVIIYIVTMTVVLILNCQDYRIGVEGLRATIQYTLWYFVVLQLVTSPKSVRLVMVIFALVTGAMALHGVIQFILGVEMPATWVDQNEAGVRTRVFSILTSPNIFGSLLTVGVPVTVALALTAKKKRGMLIFGGLAFFELSSLVFTFSRGAWIGFAVAALIYILFKDKRLLIPGIILALILIVAVPSVSNRITYMLSPEYIQSSLKGGRLVRWQQGLEILSFYPLMGVGFGQFGGAVAMNHRAKVMINATYVDTVYMDNYFLKTAVESGIVGFIAFSLVMYCVIINGHRTVVRCTENKDKVLRELSIGMTAGLTGVIVHNFFENIFETPLMSSVFWVFAALVMAVYNISCKGQARG